MQHLKIKRAKELGQVFIDMTKKEGLLATTSRGFRFIKRRFSSKKGRFLISKAQLQWQAQQVFVDAPYISFCVPVYNTPVPYLKEMVESVRAQSCNHWQLCIANASDLDSPATSYLNTLQDERIIVFSIPNKTIAENTNEAAKRATGEYLALLDHDDILAPNAVFEMLQMIQKTKAQFLYSDEALFETSIVRAHTGHFKPDFAPEYLKSCNYICHLAVFEKTLFWQVGGMDAQCNGSQDHDLFLKLSEHTVPLHLPKVLYFWRVHAHSTSAGVQAKPYVIESAKRAIQNHLNRTNRIATVQDGLFPCTYHVQYKLQTKPLVSILIPNKDHVEDLKKAVTSILEKTDYQNYEILIIENHSQQKETFAYYEEICQRYSQIQIVHYDNPFNFSAINNFARTFAKGEYLLLLNNDVEVIHESWLTEMLSLAVQPNIGIVGAKLLYFDNTVQHAGVITGLGGYAGHSHKYARAESSGYMFRLATVQNFSAVTAACLLCKASVFDEVQGFDEAFTVAYNDVDFCLRVRDAGYQILYTPYAVLYHYESKSRGSDEKGEAKQRANQERALLVQRHTKQGLLHDPFYNPNLTLDREDFSESDVLPKDEA